MPDFFEIDFLDVESPKSGDAICIRYQIGQEWSVHVVDGGFQDTGARVVEHVETCYGTKRINEVVVTHPDGDHAGGLRTVLETMTIDALWMLRPWLYADEIIHRFTRFTSVENLKARLKEVYPNIAALEAIAIKRGIPIFEPFQGQRIGAFTVMAPTKARYLDLVVQSERTPESAEEPLDNLLAALVKKMANLVKSAWGQERFSAEETSAENEMSVVQYANLCGNRILLTGDAGRGALTEALHFAPRIGLVLPGIDRFQVPHHGSRRNVSTELLDAWLGKRLPVQPALGSGSFSAIISSAKKDKDHPRKAVIRAMLHRGANVYTTEGTSHLTRFNAPDRKGWGTPVHVPYPDEQED